VLLTPSKELQSNQVNASRISEANVEIKHYIHLRYNQEKIFKEFKENNKLKVNEINQSIIEEGISLRRVKDSITLVKKSDDINNLTEEEQINSIFKLIIMYITHNYIEDRYDGLETFIKESVSKLIALKNELTAYKTSQSIILADALNDVKAHGIAVYIITGQYQTFRTSMNIFEIEAGGNIERFRSSEFREFANALDFIFTEAFEEIVARDFTVNEPVELVKSVELIKPTKTVKHEPKIIKNRVTEEEDYNKFHNESFPIPDDHVSLDIKEIVKNFKGVYNV
jgi:hypothetical protein